MSTKVSCPLSEKQREVMAMERAIKGLPSEIELEYAGARSPMKPCGYFILGQYKFCPAVCGMDAPEDAE